MKGQLKMRQVLLMAGLMAALLGAALNAQEGTAAPAKEAAPAASAAKDGAAVVTVNGQKILESAVREELNKRLDVMKQRMGGQEIGETQMQMMRKRVVDMMTEQVLLEQEMKKKNLTLTDEKVMEEIAKIAGQQNQTMEDVEKQIQQMGMTMNDLKGQIRFKMMMDTLTDAAMKDGATKPEDVKKFYDDNPQYFEQPEQVQASHILVKVEKEATADAKAEAKKKIEGLLTKVKEGGDFAALAKENSDCPSAANGGDLGLFGRGQMVKEFEDTAFGMKVGDVSGVVETQFGYHIIKLTDKKAAGKTPFDEVKDQIDAYLTQQKRNEFWQGYSKTMHDEAKIEFSPEEKALRDKMEAAAAAAAPSMQIQPNTAPAQPAEQPKAEEAKPAEAQKSEAK
jgi:peptidyl-prolyl cis-trans isomerase C